MTQRDESDGGTRRRLSLSPAMEDYLRAIYDLGRDGEAVSTTALARHLEFAPASVTGMLKRLHGLGLANHEPYAGVRLTDAGERVALEVIRHHRIIETYLAEALGVSWDAVHDEAHRLEHHISDDLGERMSEALGHPDRDPHGAPIPPRDGPFEHPEYDLLADVDAGRTVTVREVRDEDAEVLRRLDKMGLRPDVELVVLEADAEAESVVIIVDDERRDVPSVVARSVWVTTSA